MSIHEVVSSRGGAPGQGDMMAHSSFARIHTEATGIQTSSGSKARSWPSRPCRSEQASAALASERRRRDRVTMGSDRQRGVGANARAVGGQDGAVVAPGSAPLVRCFLCYSGHLHPMVFGSSPLTATINIPRTYEPPEATDYCRNSGLVTDSDVSSASTLSFGIHRRADRPKTDRHRRPKSSGTSD